MDFRAIRCSNERKHGKYDLCGHLLAAVKDGVIYLYCSLCKQFIEIQVEENDNVVMRSLPKGERLKLLNTLRVLE